MCVYVYLLFQQSLNFRLGALFTAPFPFFSAPACRYTRGGVWLLRIDTALVGGGVIDRWMYVGKR